MSLSVVGSVVPVAGCLCFGLSLLTKMATTEQPLYTAEQAKVYKAPVRPISKSKNQFSKKSVDKDDFTVFKNKASLDENLKESLFVSDKANVQSSYAAMEASQSMIFNAPQGNNFPRGGLVIFEPNDNTLFKKKELVHVAGKGKAALVQGMPTTDSEVDLSLFLTPHNDVNGQGKAVCIESVPPSHGGTDLMVSKGPASLLGNSEKFLEVVINCESSKGQFGAIGDIIAEPSVFGSDQTTVALLDHDTTDAIEPYVPQALVPVNPNDYLCDDDVLYEEDYGEDYGDDFDPESSFQSMDSTQSFILKLHGLERPKSSKEAAGPNNAQSGSSKKKMDDHDELDTAATGLKKPRN